MRVSIRGILATGSRSIATVAIALVATVMLRPYTANALPVEYIKVCSLYGPDFFYVPGTDICADVATGSARQQTSGGTWRSDIPNSPRTWLPNPQEGCAGGQLVKFGDFTGSDLILNAYSRYETNTRYPLKLKPGQFIASVMYKGGFGSADNTVSNLPACPAPNTFVADATNSSCTAGNAPVGGGEFSCEVTCVNGAWEFNGNPAGGAGNGNFCMFYFYNYPAIPSGMYTPMGCIDTASGVNVPGTLEFTPVPPIPPVTPYPVSVVGAAGRSLGATPTSDIGGMLSVWLCLQTVPGVGAHN
jgi:hypothetical protein